MRHNSVVSSHPKSTRISRVDRLSMGPPDLGRHISSDLLLIPSGSITRAWVKGLKKLLRLIKYIWANKWAKSTIV